MTMWSAFRMSTSAVKLGQINDEAVLDPDVLAKERNELGNRWQQQKSRPKAAFCN